MESPPSKRIKLEYNEDTLVKEQLAEPEEEDGEHCSICLQPYADRAMISTCSHEYCFECLLIWTDQSRRCPLCSQDIGIYIIHNIRSKYDYQKHYLPPLRTSPEPQAAAALRADARRRAVRRREIEWGRRRRRELEEADALERAVEKRRWVYRHNLFAKHVASNPYTRYRPFPTPAQFSASQDYISRATVFIRRELRVWVGLDVEFLTTFTISLMKSLDIRSEPAIRLLSEFLDMDAERGHERVNAEHFAHELYCYLRSPYRDLTAYDNNVQYDVPPNVPPSNAPQERRRRWRSRSRSSSQSDTSFRGPPSGRPPPPGRRRPPHSRSHSRDSSISSYRQRTSPSLSPRARREDERHEPSRRSLGENRSRSAARRRHRSRSRGSSHRPSPPPRPADNHFSNSSRPSIPEESGSIPYRYGEKGKGKDRAEDNSAARPRIPSSPSKDDDIVVSGGELAGIHRNAQGSSGSGADGLNSLTGHALSTQACGTSTQIQDRGANISDPQSLSDVRDQVMGSTSPRIEVDGTVGGHPSASQARPAVRVRRNAWQTMQEHLASGGRETRSSKRREAPSGPDLASSSQSQASKVNNPGPLSRERALHSEDAPHPVSLASDGPVPSLLLRLSDPAPVPHTRGGVGHASANASEGRAGLATSPRPSLSAPERGRLISVSEMVARTRAHSPGENPSSAPRSRTRPHAGVPAPLPHPSQQSEPSSAVGTAGEQQQPSSSRYEEGTDDVGAVGGVERMHISSAPGASHSSGDHHRRCRGSSSDETSIDKSGGRGSPRSGATPARADPRFILLMEKLEKEKRRAAVPSAAPTADVQKKKSDGRAGSPSQSQSQSQMHSPSLTLSPPQSSGAALGSAAAVEESTRPGPTQADADADADMDVDADTSNETRAVVEAAERSASAARREAQLRSQAQLRVRLAAAKRAALAVADNAHAQDRVGVGGTSRPSHGGPGTESTADVQNGVSGETRLGLQAPSSATVVGGGGGDEGLVSQEMVLKSKLRARRA